MKLIDNDPLHDNATANILWSTILFPISLHGVMTASIF